MVTTSKRNTFECGQGLINNYILPLSGCKKGLSLGKPESEGPLVTADSCSGNRFGIFYWKGLGQMCFRIQNFVDHREIIWCIYHLEHDTPSSQNHLTQYSNISAVKRDHSHWLEWANSMNSFTTIQGRLHCPVSHGRNFQFSELLGLQVRDFGSVIDVRLFLALENITAPILYEKISIFLLKLYSRYKWIWHALCLNSWITHVFSPEMERFNANCICILESGEILISKIKVSPSRVAQLDGALSCILKRLRVQFPVRAHT